MPTQHLLTLNFHGLGRPAREVASGEQPYWLPVRLFEEILDAVQPHAGVQVTFDDGNASDHEHALPALLARGLTAQVFVLAGKIGAPGYLSADQIIDLARQGMPIGLHGMDHRPWPACGAEELEVEIHRARERLAAVVGAPVTRAACPFGAYDRRTLAVLERAGFEIVYTSDRGYARASQWLQCRNTLRRDHGVEDVLAWLRSSPRAPREYLRRARTLIKRLR